MPLLKPDRYFTRISAIDIDADLISRGKDVLLLDIDNTLRSRETGGIPDDVASWLDCAREKGIRMCLVSNNWHADVHAFAAGLGMPIVARACKPLPFAYMRAFRQSGIDRARAVAIGDQLTTDIWGAHAVGVPAFLVEPLAEKDLRHTKVVRRFERAVLGDLRPER